MELEHDLRKLRWKEAPAGLRARVLSKIRAAPRLRLLPPWVVVLERHWLYPGRAPAAALVLAWLIIASFRFATPTSLLPPVSFSARLTDEDLARFEAQHAELIALLRQDQLDARDFESSDAEPQTQAGLPPRG